MDNGYVLLTEMDSMWAEMLIQVLKDHSIVCTSAGVYGAGLTARSGCRERYRIFVPGEDKEQAMELLKALFPEVIP